MTTKTMTTVDAARQKLVRAEAQLAQHDVELAALREQAAKDWTDPKGFQRVDAEIRRLESGRSALVEEIEQLRGEVATAEQEGRAKEERILRGQIADVEHQRDQAIERARVAWLTCVAELQSLYAEAEVARRQLDAMGITPPEHPVGFLNAGGQVPVMKILQFLSASPEQWVQQLNERAVARVRRSDKDMAVGLVPYIGGNTDRPFGG